MLILYGNIYKVTRNRLPADVRLRRSASVDQESRRPICTDTTPGTPLIGLQAIQQQATTATTATKVLVQTVNSESSSASSAGRHSDAVLRQQSGPNTECFEMVSVQEELRTPPQRHPTGALSTPTGALSTLRVWRSNSSPQSRSGSSARASLCNLRYFSSKNNHTSNTNKHKNNVGSASLCNLRYSSSSKNEWRRTSCLVAGEVAARRENKAAKTLAIVVGGFVSCWLPFFVLYVVEPFCSSCRVSDAVRSVLTWLGYANSLVNPFIYATYNRHFRHSFWSLTIGRFYACVRRRDGLSDVTDIQVTL